MTEGAAKPPCAGRWDLFFADPSAVRKIAEAKAICRGCWRREDCYADALAHRELHGVWGGVDFNGTAGRAEHRRAQRVRAMAQAIEDERPVAA